MLKKAMRFTKCDVCTLANEALDVERKKGGVGTMTAAMETIKRHLLDHYEDVKKSRLAYMAAKMLACANPLELLCIAIDGADQSAFATPYFCQETKDSVKGWKMRMKLIGALVSGRMCMFYTLGSNWESGANLTIEVLHKTLVKLVSTLQPGQQLPRRLWLQMDNCSRENKNRFFLAYLHLLVHYGVFDCIELHFGLKGHTHDEIDQVFSRVGVGLRKRDAPTRSALGEGIVSSYKAGSPNFVVELQHLRNCANVRDLVKECLFAIPHVTKPQAFKVSKDPTDGEVKFQVQPRSYKDDWGIINRSAEYEPGYMTLMKSWPDVRECPPHPRKALPDNTLRQHQLCIESATPRIKNKANTTSVLPDGLTANGLFDKTMLELTDSVLELGQSEPVPFGWGEECAMYNLDASRQTPPDPLPSAQNNSGAESAGTSPLGHGGVQGQRQSEEPAFRVEVGEFVAFATPCNLVESVLVGKVTSVNEEGDGGHELEMQWYRPATVTASTVRSTYGRGRWVEEFIVQDGRRVRSTGADHIAAVSAVFAKLNTSGTLPKHVWDSVPNAKAVGTEGSVGDSGGDEEEIDPGEEVERSMPQESPLPVVLPESPVQPESPAVDTQGGGGSSPSPALQSEATPAPTHLSQHPNVRITAAFSRPRRGNS
ncbi:unnamed protein product [Ectocarpus fasciculatus]